MLWKGPALPTYRSTTAPIVDAQAFGRDPEAGMAVRRWTANEALPAGAAAGDRVVLPKGLVVEILDHRFWADDLLIEVVGADAAGFVWRAWTRAANLGTAMLNHGLTADPPGWTSLPWEPRVTVTDAQAVIRRDPPDFAPTGQVYDVGERLHVYAESGEYLQVGKVESTANGWVQKPTLRWTRTTNVQPGVNPGYASDAFASPKGAYARWRDGVFQGCEGTVWLVGKRHRLVRLGFGLFPVWRAMSEAARADGVVLLLNSGFRTWGEQETLYQMYLSGTGNPANRPGKSNHQTGIAVDVDVNDDDSSEPWLTQNATAHGFVRTVRGEPWHWEHRPAEAAAARAKGRWWSW